MALSNDSVSYFCVLFDRRLRPLIAGIRSHGNDAIIPLFIPGTSRKIYDIHKSIKKLNQWIEQSLLNDKTIVTNDLKSILTGFNFKLPRERLNIYDVFQPTPQIPSTIEEATLTINNALYDLQKHRLYMWQKVAANASVVYESLERSGILVGGLQRYPKWTHRTVSGRSKNTGFNLQGTTENDPISDPRGNELDLFINFDWQAADIRIAAILSGDEELNRMSIESDPYLKLSEIIDVPRKECKIMLLRAINAIDVDNPIFQIFPDLRRWMIRQKESLDNEQPISSILGRRFFNAEKPRSAFNSTMQGSIAQAMQLVIRRVWELGYRLLAETHDSITIACDKSTIKPTIREVANIMCRPFAGVLDSNPVFPVRIKIGKKWCQWKPCGIYLDVDKFKPS
ncbi:MAG: DNA polymerase [Candidatus Cloacimonetes bacterium]|jgi:hypothetical protein|nr:DNA polymerase [Candidatus Cloacimonadota bacterium]